MPKTQAIREVPANTVATTNPLLMPVALGVLFEHLRELPETQGWNLIRSANGAWMLCDPDTGDCSIQAEIDRVAENKINLGWSEGLATFGERRHLSLLVSSNEGEFRFTVWDAVVTAQELTKFLHTILFPVPSV